MSSNYRRFETHYHFHLHRPMKMEPIDSYRPGVAQRVGRGIAVFCHDRGTRRGWVVSVTFRPYFTPEKDPVPTVQEAGWVPGPVWTDEKSRPHRDSIPDHPARSQSLYRLSYRAHVRKGKSVPLQAWSGSEGSRKLRFPDFMTTAQDSGKVVSLMHRPPLPPRKYTWYSFLLEAESTPGP